MCGAPRRNNSNKYDGTVSISFIYYGIETVNRKDVVNECYQYSNICFVGLGIFEYFKEYNILNTVCLFIKYLF